MTTGESAPGPLVEAQREGPAREWVCAAVLFGLLVVEGWRQGGFWSNDALGLAVASVAVAVIAAILEPPDGRGFLLVGSVTALAGWWLVRALTFHTAVSFLPFGASLLAFAAAFLATRSLRAGTREFAAFGVAALGAVGALIGLSGLILRWFPMAIPAQHLWRLSTTLTYADTAGLVLAMCLLLALGLDLQPAVVRAVICLDMAGLLATQSRGAYVAAVCACALVPWRRYADGAVPLLAGLAIGVTAIATSPGGSAVPLLAIVVVAGTAVAVLWRPSLQSLHVRLPPRWFLAVLLTASALVLVVLLHHEIGLRTLSPSDQDRSVEWSTAWHQWVSAPVAGVGPDHLLIFHASDGTLAHFAHNEYLQVGADAGLIGAALLVLVIVSVARVARRFDVLSSCAVAALVCLAVAGAFDFDWHLGVVGLLGGWCVGLATPDRVAGRASDLRPRLRRAPAPAVLP